MSFETATRSKYRYPSNKGEITTEHLWDLPLQAKSGFDLDNVAKEINRQLKEEKDESFVAASSNPRKTVLEDQLALVVHIIGIKQAENASRAGAATRAAERQRLLEILHLRTQEDLMKKTPEEIQAMIDSLGNS